MTNARFTLSTILGAVAATANAVTNTVGAINQGADMLNRSIDNAAKNQNLRLIKSQALYKEQLQHDAHQELAEITMAAITYRSKSEAHKAAYDDAVERLKDMFATTK